MNTSTTCHNSRLASDIAHKARAPFALQGVEWTRHDEQRRDAPLNKPLIEPVVGYLIRLTQAYEQAASQLPDFAERATDEPVMLRASCWEYLLLVWSLCQPSLTKLGVSPRLGQAVDELLHWNLFTQGALPGQAGLDPASLIRQRRALAQGVMATPSPQQQADYLRHHYPLLLLEKPLGYHSIALGNGGRSPRAEIRRTLQHRWVSDYLLMTMGTLVRDQRFEQFVRAIQAEPGHWVGGRGLATGYQGKW